MENTVSVSIGSTLNGLTSAWALITQCLAWAGVVDWSYVAIVGPLLISLAITFLVALIVALIA